jgi:hypothetical protein
MPDRVAKIRENSSDESHSEFDVYHFDGWFGVLHNYISATSSLISSQNPVKEV